MNFEVLHHEKTRKTKPPKEKRTTGARKNTMRGKAAVDNILSKER